MVFGGVALQLAKGGVQQMPLQRKCVAVFEQVGGFGQPGHGGAEAKGRITPVAHDLRHPAADTPRRGWSWRAFVAHAQGGHGGAQIHAFAHHIAQRGVFQIREKRLGAPGEARQI